MAKIKCILVRVEDFELAGRIAEGLQEDFGDDLGPFKVEPCPQGYEVTVEENNDHLRGQMAAFARGVVRGWA